MAKLMEFTDADNRNSTNQLALFAPIPGDGWEDHLVYCLFVVAVIPETAFWPTLVVVCDKKIEVSSTHWTWDVEEKHKPFSTYALDSYASRLRYKNSEKTWADVHVRRFKDFVLEVKDEQIQRAVKRWKREQLKAALRITPDWFKAKRKQFAKWLLSFK